MSLAVLKERRSPRKAAALPPAAVFKRADAERAYITVTYALGRVCGGLLLLITAPVIGLLVVVVRLTSKGPGIYKQVRVGLDGTEFTMYKIRTMYQNAELATGPVWSTKCDPRSTPLGVILRKLHLDEFPQLINVVRGEMALIGPRPERPEFTQLLAREIPGYTERLKVKPGITGLAQINLPPDSDLDSVRRKLVLDVEYIRHACLALDARISVCTAMRLFAIPSEFASRITGLCRYQVYTERHDRQRERSVRRQQLQLPQVEVVA